MAKAAAKEMQRLDKIVAHLTGLSRQNATRIIKDGDVCVDEEVITNAATKVSINSVIVIAGFNDAASALDNDDEELSLEVTTAADAFKKRVFILNKPFGYVCADRDKNHAIVASLFRSELNIEALHSAGRLDIDTTGLLIVTDDGDLNHEITSPKKTVSKVYLAKLDKEVPQSAIASFERGIKHPEEKKRYQSAALTIFAPEDHEYNGEHWAAVALSEGRYHEVKRLFEMVGCEVIELVRVAIGSLTLPKELALAEYVSATDEMKQALFEPHDYTKEELLALFNTYKANMKRSKLIYLPEQYAKQLVATSSSASASAAASASANGSSEVASEGVNSAVWGKSPNDLNSAPQADMADKFDDAESDLDADESDEYYDDEDMSEVDELYYSGADDDEEEELGDFDEVDDEGNLRIY